MRHLFVIVLSHISCQLLGVNNGVQVKLLFFLIIQSLNSNLSAIDNEELMK